MSTKVSRDLLQTDVQHALGQTTLNCHWYLSVKIATFPFGSSWHRRQDAFSAVIGREVNPANMLSVHFFWSTYSSLCFLNSTWLEYSNCTWFFLKVVVVHVAKVNYKNFNFESKGPERRHLLIDWLTFHDIFCVWSIFYPLIITHLSISWWKSVGLRSIFLSLIIRKWFQLSHML